MRFELPVVLVEGEGVEARALFVPDISARAASRGLALERLARDLSARLEAAAREERHDRLATWTFAPEVEAHALPLRLELRRRAPEIRVLVAAFRHKGTRVALFPRQPDLWFTVDRGSELPARAAEVLAHHLLAREKQGEEVDPDALGLASRDRVRIERLELDVAVPSKHLPRPAASPFAFLGRPATRSGAEELARVGRHLNRLVPDGLQRAYGRDPEVAELLEALAPARPAPRRSLVLLGPPGVGKTAVLGEAVTRLMTRPVGATGKRKAPEVWSISPPRLVSGMSFVGQWEERVLAILGECEKKGRVLAFTDLVSLFHIGISASSSLAVATVLAPWIEAGRVMVVGEATPEEFSRVRELSRGFADLFRILPIRPQDRATAMTTVLSVRRDLEAKTGCRIAPGLLANLPEAARRAFDRASPGAEVELLQRVAKRHAGKDAGEDQLLDELAEATGLSHAFLDPRFPMPRERIRAGIAGRVVGQEAAVDALADAVSVAKARLEDRGRPLSVFLFLGPTGVGKTECARTLARVLFGADRGMVRFDMNQYRDPGAALRLVGGRGRPEGELVSAVRHRPWCVLLLDEIEKAHPAVHDVLLAILGEGRASDARGRTVDFTRTMVVMTSNLGSGEATAPGFATSAPSGSSPGPWRKAVERFFRPEFLGRIDRIVPFAPLSRSQVAGIARHLLAELLGREGLTRRRTLLEVEDEALEAIVDEGYDPELGARALRRALERRIGAVVAERLSVLAPDLPTLVEVAGRGGPRGLSVTVQALAEIAPSALASRALAEVPEDLVLAGSARALARIDRELDAGGGGELMEAGRIRPEALDYLRAREGWKAASARLEGLERSATTRRPGSWAVLGGGSPKHRRRVAPGWLDEAHRDLLRRLAAAEDVHAAMEQLAEAARRPEGGERLTARLGLAEDLARLSARAGAGRSPQETVELRLVPRRGAEDMAGLLCAHYHELVEALGLSLEVRPAADREGAAHDRPEVKSTLRSLAELVHAVDEAEAPGAPACTRSRDDVHTHRLRVVGAGAARLLAPECGTHLLWTEDGRFAPVVVDLATGGGDSGDPGVGTPGSGLPAVVRVYEIGGRCLDLATRRVFDTLVPSPVEHVALLSALLPLPPELSGLPGLLLRRDG